MTPPVRELRPALDAAADGATVALPEPGVGIPSALEQLLAKGRLRATLLMLGGAIPFAAGARAQGPGVADR